jgi:hypothetical protein
MAMVLYSTEVPRVYNTKLRHMSSIAYDPMEVRREALSLLKPGAKIVLAAHCHQTTGGQGIDIGLINVQER